MSELERIKQAMTDGEHTDGDLEWCVDRIAALEKELKAEREAIKRVEDCQQLAYDRDREMYVPLARNIGGVVTAKDIKAALAREGV